MPSENESMQQVLSKSNDGKVFKIKGEIRDELTDWELRLTDVENPCYRLKRMSLRLRNFFLRVIEKIEISFVGKIDISSCTESEQPRAKEKHLTNFWKIA